MPSSTGSAAARGVRFFFFSCTEVAALSQARKAARPASVIETSSTRLLPLARLRSIMLRNPFWLRVDMPLDALVSLVITFNEGIILERLAGIETGQEDLLGWIDRWLERRESP